MSAGGKLPKNDRERMMALAARYSFVGLQITACVAIGAFGGQWLDQRWNTEPWLLLVGMALGTAAAARSVWAVVKSTHLDEL